MPQPKTNTQPRKKNKSIKIFSIYKFFQPRFCLPLCGAAGVENHDSSSFVFRLSTIFVASTKKRLISYFLPTKLLFPGAPNFRQKLKIKFHINFSNLNHIYLSHKQSSPQRCILFIRDTDFICHIKFVEVEAKTKGRYNTIFAISFARSAMTMVEERATFTNSPSFAQ